MYCIMASRELEWERTEVLGGSKQRMRTAPSTTDDWLLGTSDIVHETER